MLYQSKPEESTWTNVEPEPDAKPLTLASLQETFRTIRELSKQLKCLHCQRERPRIVLRPRFLTRAPNSEGVECEWWALECIDEVECRQYYFKSLMNMPFRGK